MSASYPSERTFSLLNLVMLIPGLLLCVPAFVAYQAEGQLQAAFQSVSHTLEVQRELRTLLSVLIDAETGQRGYLLTARDYYLEPYRSAMDRLAKQIETLRNLTKSNETQQSRLGEMTPLIRTRLDLIEQTITLQKDGRKAEALALVETDRGKQTMDAIRVLIASMDAEESRLLQLREDRLDRRAQWSTALLFGLVAVNALFAGAIFIMYRRLARAKQLVTICAWSRTVEYEGEWISFEAYLLRRFNLNVSHGISPAEMEKSMDALRGVP